MSDANGAVFLSYASQDSDAALRICEALRAAGVEVWFDQSELRGGDAWDQKIRRQIKDCALFVPIISANTQARHEGYFRLEWRLADQRTHLMGKSRAFLMPVCIDNTRDAHADVPDSFVAVHWTRLPDGETSATFCARVKALLADDSGRDVSPQRPMETAHTAHGRPGETFPPRTRGMRRWLLPAIAGLATIVTLGIWQPWKNGATNPSVALTEARQLTLKARALIDDDLMAVRENFRMAEEFCLRAVALDNTDAEAWATLARISTEMIGRSYDSRPQRRDSARSQAERAIRLGPDSIEAGLAMADYLAVTGENAEAEKQLRSLFARAPRDPRVARALANALEAIDRDAEATEIRLHHPAFGGRDPRPLLDETRRLRREGRFVAAEALIDRAQALAPTPDGYRYKVVVLGLETGELEAARVYLESIPPQILLEDAMASRAAQVWIRLGRGEKALEVMHRIPRDFFEENVQVYPKGFLAGWALRIAGRSTAAEAEWQQALTVVEKRLAAEPNKLGLLYWKALLLALTGQTEEATKVHRLQEELSVRSSSRADLRNATFHAALGRIEEAITALRSASSQGIFAITLCQTLRHDPWFAVLRGDPRVQQIIVDGEVLLRELRKAGTTPDVLNSKSQTPNSESSRPAADAKSVAVLAFTNLPDDKSNEYFSDGISEELLNLLGKVPGLRVAARTSAFHFKGKDTPIPDIARQLGVAYVVEGSVRKAGTQLRITARLLSGADGKQVWADDFREELKDVFALQDKIAGLIAKNLSVQLGAGEPTAVTAGVPTRNLEAYDFYLRARALHTGGLAEQTTLEAMRLYEHALRLDPNYALAAARLAEVCARTAMGGFDRVDPDVKGRTAAATALRLDPSLPEAHLAQAAIWRLDGDFAAAQRELDLVERLRPNSVDVPAARAGLAYASGKVGNELADLVARAIEADPQNASNLSAFADMLGAIGRFGDAERLLERAELAGDPAEANVRKKVTNFLVWTGDVEAALTLMNSRFTAARPNHRLYSLRAELRVIQGDLKGALADYERARAVVTEFYPNRSGPVGTAAVALREMARIVAQQGDRAAAARYYEDALAEAEKVIRDVPGIPAGYRLRALVHADQGRADQAVAAIEELNRHDEARRDVPRIMRGRKAKAQVLAILGRHDSAIAALRSVHEAGYAFGHALRRDPDLASLRGDPAFQQLMQESEARADAQPRPRGAGPRQGSSGTPRIPQSVPSAARSLTFRNQP